MHLEKYLFIFLLETFKICVKNIYSGVSRNKLWVGADISFDSAAINVHSRW